MRYKIFVLRLGFSCNTRFLIRPWQNKVAEKKNRSLKDMASCMLHAKSLSQSSWETYIKNISPHRSVKDKTPYEAWSGLKPEVTHFRIFGSRAWARIPS
jgi:hypothetical protein